MDFLLQIKEESSMDNLCPVCNGFVELRATCTNCNHPMDDRGKLEDYYGPYSPYEENDLITATGGSGSTCYHVAFCPKCESAKPKGVEIIALEN